MFPNLRYMSAPAAGSVKQPKSNQSSGGGWASAVESLVQVPLKAIESASPTRSTTQTNYAPAASFAAAPSVDAEAQARINALRGNITGNRSAIEQAYRALFGDLDALAKARASEVEQDFGRNIGEITEQYTSSIPGIESSYAAIGAGDSTDTRDAKNTAKSGFEKSTAELGRNKEADLAKIGSYVDEQKANWGAERDSILRLIGRVGETEDEGDLRRARNQVEDTLGKAKASRSTIQTDAGARGKLREITGDGGRYDAIKSSLDSILNSSMSGGVKSAAVQAVMGSSDISDEDKRRIQQEYGNIYGEQAAL